MTSFCFLIRLVDLINSIFFLDFSVQDATLTFKNENSTTKETKNWISATFCISFFPWLCNVEKWFNSGLSGRVSKLQKTFRVTLNDHQRMMGLPQKMPKFEPISEKIDLNYSIQITFTYATKLCTRIMNILRVVKIEIRKWVLWIL